MFCAHHSTINSDGKRITGIFTGDPKWLERIFWGNSVWRHWFLSLPRSCQALAKADSFAVTFDNSLKMPTSNTLPGPRGYWHLQFSTGSVG